MNKPTSPCYDEKNNRDCPDRCAEPNCHFSCERYLAFTRECKEFRKVKLKVAKEHYDLKAIEDRRIRLATSGGMYHRGRNGRRHKR